MTELRTKRVTHAQSPYITVGACKLFNSLAYPMLAEESLFSLTGFPFLSTSIVSRTERGPTNYWSSIEARKKHRVCVCARPGLNAFSFSSLSSSFTISFPAHFLHCARHTVFRDSVRYPLPFLFFRYAPSSSFNPFFLAGFTSSRIMPKLRR